MLTFVEDPNVVTFTNLYMNYYTPLLMTNTVNGSGLITAITLLYPSGAFDVYGLTQNTNMYEMYAYLTAKVDASGHTNLFTLVTNGGILQLTQIVDGDGNTNTIKYSTSFPSQISEIDDPFGRKATLQYNSSGYLTNITDTQGLTSAFSYDANWGATNLTTPYGPTTFLVSTTNAPATGYIDMLSILVTLPNGTNQELFLYNSDASVITGVTVAVPDSSPFGNQFDSGISWRNSYHWNSQQYAALSTTNITSFTTNDYNKALEKHWLHDDNPLTYVAGTLSSKRQPSVDGGVTLGQRIFYDYPNNANGANTIGSGPVPYLTGEILPDGTSWFTYSQLSIWNIPTNVVDTFTTVGTNVLYRTNIFNYANNGQDLLQHFGPNGELLAGYSYNGAHQLLTATNAVGDVTTYLYDSAGRLASVTSPAGLVTTNYYYTSGVTNNHLRQTIDLALNRTNTYTYLNGLVYTHTDELGMTTTNLWDNLQRLVSVAYPDGTTVSNLYVNLDSVATKDRLGNWTWSAFDSLRRLAYTTNALGNVTTYDYCLCNAVSEVIDALGNTTSMTYDLQGRLVNKLWPDGTFVTNIYDVAGRLVQVADTLGHTTTNWYSNNGLRTSSSNAFGLVQSTTFDNEDRATNLVTLNGVSIYQSFDYLGRVVNRTYPDGGVEQFGFSSLGFIAYTNQLTQVTRYFYDAGLRACLKTAQK